MSRSHVHPAVIAERERHKAPFREVGIPLYLPLPEPPGRRDALEQDDVAEAEIFVVWGDDDED